MEKPKVYLETSFISYLVARRSYDLVTLQRQLSSQSWWEDERRHFDLFASQTVHEECRAGDKDSAQKRGIVLEETSLLVVTAQIRELATQLVYPGPLPRVAEADAIHIAAATAYQCDYLLTWNFTHINNAQIKRAAARIIEEYGYRPTTICTPDELMGPDREAQG